jgi:hypothetical protein
MSYNLRSKKGLNDNDVNSGVVDVLDKEKEKHHNFPKKKKAKENKCYGS